MFKVDSRKIKLWGHFFWGKREKRKSRLSKKGKRGAGGGDTFPHPLLSLI